MTGFEWPTAAVLQSFGPAPTTYDPPEAAQELDDAYWEDVAANYRQRWMIGAPDGSWAVPAAAQEKEPLPEKEGVDYVEVYRVEHNRTGEGPYNCDYTLRLDDMCYAHANPDHPNLWNDTFEDPYAIDKSYYFAFETRESLDSWFDGWQGPLAAKGFAVVTYRVPADRVMAGSKQVVFVKDEASRVALQPLV